jgi:hypothetical protein
VSKSLISTQQREEAIRDVIRWQLDGWKRSEIIKELKERFGELLSPAAISVLVDESRSVLAYENSSDVMQCIDTHVVIYEDIYRWFCEYGDGNGSNRALSQKEKLLGLHKEDRSIVINNTINVTEETGHETYDITKLSIEQKDRLNHLLLKAKKYG